MALLGLALLGFALLGFVLLGFALLGFVLLGFVLLGLVLLGLVLPDLVTATCALFRGRLGLAWLALGLACAPDFGMDLDLVGAFIGKAAPRWRS